MGALKISIVGGAGGVGASLAFNLLRDGAGDEVVLIDSRPVIGYTLNDTLRFRTGIALALGAELGSVEAWVIGEHGDGCVPLDDRVKLNGEPVELTPEQAAAAEDFLRNWYVRHVALDSG